MVKEALPYKQILYDFAMAIGMEKDYQIFKLVRKVWAYKIYFAINPVFMLSTLLAPKGVLQQFRAIQRDFLWGKGGGEKQMGLGSMG